MHCRATESGALKWGATGISRNRLHRPCCSRRSTDGSGDRHRRTHRLSRSTRKTVHAEREVRRRTNYLSPMPIVPFDALPNTARVWVFASDRPLAGAVADTLLAAVDRFLSEWKAHGVPLRCARDWRDGRFLAV